MRRFLTINKAEILLLVVAFVWGSGFPINKIANNMGFSTFTVLAGRFLLASVILSVLFFKKLRSLPRKTGFVGVLMGIVLLVAFGLQTYGLEQTTSSKNAFIVQLIVVVVPFISFLIYRKKLKTTLYLAALIALAGVVVLSLNTDLLVEINRGDWITFASVVFSSVYLIESARLMEKHDIDPIPFSIIQFATVGVMSSFFALLFDDIPSFEVAVWWPIVFLGVFNTAFGYLGQNIALKVVEPSKISIIVSLEAVFASILEILLLAVVFNPLVFLGGGLILLAVIVSQTNPIQTKERKPYGKKSI